MRKYACVDDIGNIVNPLIVAGQVHGGLVQGIAQALWEEAVHDDAGHPGLRLVRRLPACRRRPTRSASTSTTRRRRRRPTRSAPRASARRAPSPRRRPWSTRWSTRCGRSASTTSRMPCTPERVCKAIHAQDGAESGGGATEGAAAPHFDEADTGRPPTDGQEHASDPRPVRLPRARPRSRRRSPRSPSTGTTPRSSPAGRACCRCSGCGSTPRRWSSTSARSRRCAASATTATRSSSAR